VTPSRGPQSPDLGEDRTHDIDDFRSA